MAKQLNLSFKENDTELELYTWVKQKLNPGTYIKEILYADYLAEKNGSPRATSSNTQKDTKSEENSVAIEETNVDNSEWDCN